MEIVNRIREHRESRGWTQKDLGRRVGVSRQSINSIERGRYVPSLLAAIADVIEKHMVDIGFLNSDQAASGIGDAPKAIAAGVPEGVIPEGSGATCPRCGHPSLHHREGCLACLDCGYSKCA